jgi:hypothetical protein
MRYFAAFLLSLLLLLSTGAVANAQTLPTQTYSNGQQEVQVPDWSEIDLSELPSLQDSGYIDIAASLVSKLGYDPSRSWEAGDAIEEVMMLGDVQKAFRLEEFALQHIAERTGYSMESFTLDDFGVMKEQTLQSLTQAIPGLADIQAEKIEPVKALLQKAGIAGNILGGDHESVLNETIGEVVEEYSDSLKDLTFGEIDLAKYDLTSIPALKQTAIKEFKAWAGSFIADIPLLNQVPFSQFPKSLATGLDLVGRVDVVWGQAEYGNPEVGANDYVSGSGGKEGETKPVPCDGGKPCAYLELADFFGVDLGVSGLEGITGQRWASGATQKVEGGFGVLGNVNGGKEPAGRLVYGSPFKVAVTDTSEPQGKAERGLYFRVCMRGGLVDLGCTPYFIGPIPWFPVQEKGMIILAGADAPPVDIPESYQEEIDKVLSEYQPEETPSNDEDVPTEGPCVEQLVETAPAGMQETAQDSIPLLLEEAKAAGLSQAQTAYVLATVQKESLMGKAVEEWGGESQPYAPYYGRGYIQITHKENYIYWGNRLGGVDLVNNPELALDSGRSAKITVQGMKDGTYTGITPEGNLVSGGSHKLSDFINKNETDFYNARKIVNNADDAGEIANNAEQYFKVLKECNVGGGEGDGEATGDYSNPAPGYPMTSDFGKRPPPCPGCSTFHPAVDLGTPMRTPIAAADGGEVIFAGRNGGYGKTVKIDHGNGEVTRYSHLNSISVGVGDKVSKGQEIARSGKSGKGTGPHLDFGISKNGEAVDPEKHIDF